MSRVAKKNLPGARAGRKAVVLLSGGLDSATALYAAKSKGYRCFALIFDYGQRHRKEILRAVSIARHAGVDYRVLKITFPWKGSALLDKKIKLPEKVSKNIPSTYVPARNIIFLSFALSLAEVQGAGAVFIGVHSQDYSGYPDCRPQFFNAFNRMAAVGLASRGKIKIFTPLIHLDKAAIIKLGARLGVPFALTSSCYRETKFPCGRCDSCYYRAKGFREAGIADPALRP